MIKFKIIVAGAKGVGKTSLIRRFCTGKFDMSTLSTIGVEFETKKVVVEDNIILLNIWDFAGEEKFRTLFPSYVNGASGALILYDIANSASLDDLKQWLEIIDKNENPPNTKILIGSKLDLEEYRQIPRKDALAFYKKYNFQGEIIECSSKTGYNVEQIFVLLGKEILKNSLTKCSSCGNFYPKELLYCQFCGEKTNT
jgi:small GTP-binding protein